MSAAVVDMLIRLLFEPTHQRLLDEQVVDNDDKDDDDNNNNNNKGDLFASIASNVFLFFLIFGLSATVEIKNLRKQLGNKFAIGTGVGMQFLIMPVLGFVSVVALRDHGLTEAMGISLLVVTSSPGGSYSNWWCSTFNADLALSVAMTTVSSLMSIGMLPANLLLYSYLSYGNNEEESIMEALDFGTLFISLGIVMGAIILGLYAGYRYDNARFHMLANKLGSISGLCLILFGLFIGSGGGGGVNDDDDDEETTSFWEHGWAFYLGVAAPCLLGICLANVISRSLRLAPPETVAISIECCYQNTGIATSVAITMFEGEERAQAVAVPLLYGAVEAVAIGLYCVWAWKMGWTKAPADEKLCTVITKSYEVSYEDGDGDNNHAAGTAPGTTHDRDSDDPSTSLAEGAPSSSPSTSAFADEEGGSSSPSHHSKQRGSSSSSTDPRHVQHASEGRSFVDQMKRLFVWQGDDALSAQPPYNRNATVVVYKTSTASLSDDNNNNVEITMMQEDSSDAYQTPSKRHSTQPRTADYTDDTVPTSSSTSSPTPKKRFNY